MTEKQPNSYHAASIHEVIRQCQELTEAQAEAELYAEAYERRIVIPAEDLAGAVRVMTVSLKTTSGHDERYDITAELSRDLVYDELPADAKQRLADNREASAHLREIVIETNDASLAAESSPSLIAEDGYRYVLTSAFQVDPVEETVIRSLKEVYSEGDVELVVGQIDEDEIDEAPSDFMKLVDELRQEQRQQHFADCLGILAVLQCQTAPRQLSHQLFPYQG